MKAIDREGSFRCKVLNWGARGAGTEQAVSVTMQLQVVESWNFQTKTWEDFTSYDPLLVYMDLYVVKKSGEVNPSAVEQLTAAVGFAGDMLMFDAEPPAALEVVVDVRGEVYEGKTSFRGRWLSPANHTPGTGGIARALDKGGLEALNARVGSQLRAAAGAAAAKLKKKTPF